MSSIDPGDSRFIRLAGLSAMGAAVAGLIYSVTFIGLVVLGNAPRTGAIISSIALMLGAILTVIVFAGLYRLLLASGGGLVLLTLLLGVTAAFGAAIHGGYDLAVAVNPPPPIGAVADLPQHVDPRGLLTFGVSGIAALLASSLIRRDGRFPAGLASLGYLAGTLLIVIYLGRLIILDPTAPLVAGPAALAGFIVNPAWYVWLGVVLRRLSALL